MHGRSGRPGHTALGGGGQRRGGGGTKGRHEGKGRGGGLTMMRRTQYGSGGVHGGRPSGIHVASRSSLLFALTMGVDTIQKFVKGLDLRRRRRVAAATGGRGRIVIPRSASRSSDAGRMTSRSPRCCGGRRRLGSRRMTRSHGSMISHIHGGGAQTRKEQLSNVRGPCGGSCPVYPCSPSYKQAKTMEIRERNTIVIVGQSFVTIQ